mmetsp:Transcript_2737/g.3748  ORF Transcript_2737/g.3748 Transcript_2737/m.3748 type:complete len:132 (-) Transcript_2737:85-480(-)
MRMGVRGKRFFVFPMCITVQFMALVLVFCGDERFHKREKYLHFYHVTLEKEERFRYVCIFSLKHKRRNKKNISLQEKEAVKYQSQVVTVSAQWPKTYIVSEKELGSRTYLYYCSYTYQCNKYGGRTFISYI